MPSRLLFLSLAAALLFSPAAGAAGPALSAGETPAFFAPAEPALGCGQAALFAASAQDKAVPCGSCSESICQGRSTGSFCKSHGGRTYRCTNVYGNLCPGTPTTQECYCWTGPIP